MAYKKSEPENDKAGAVPSSLADLGTRINAIVDLFKFKRDAAEVGGVSVEQLNRYGRGENVPPFDVLAKLAASKRINLNWLATGEGAMYGASSEIAQAVDEDLMSRISDGISRVYKEENARLNAADHGMLTARTLNKLLSIYDDPAERKIGLKAVLEEVRGELRATPTADAASSKRLA